MPCILCVQNEVFSEVDHLEAEGNIIFIPVFGFECILVIACPEKPLLAAEIFMIPHMNPHTALVGVMTQS